MCVGGTFQLGHNATTCVTCPAGAFCGEGTASPVPCPPGTHSESEGLVTASSCTLCPAGYFCIAGMKIACVTGYYNSDPGASDLNACQQCVPHATTLTSASTNATDCVCVEGYAMDAGNCFPCPTPGTDCINKNTTFELLPISRGWWRPTGTKVVSACYTPGVCVGGVDSSAYCKEGHAGAWCDGCKEGWYRAADLPCRECSDVYFTPQGLVVFAVLGLVVIALGACYLNTMRKGVKKRKKRVASKRSQKMKRIYTKVKAGAGNK